MQSEELFLSENEGCWCGEEKAEIILRIGHPKASLLRLFAQLLPWNEK